MQPVGYPRSGNRLVDRDGTCTITDESAGLFRRKSVIVGEIQSQPAGQLVAGTRSEVVADDSRSKYVEKLLSSRNGISTIVKYHRQSRWLGW